MYNYKHYISNNYVSYKTKSLNEPRLIPCVKQYGDPARKNTFKNGFKNRNSNNH